MNNKLNLDGKLDFTELDLTAPNEVVRKIIDELAEQTHGIVLGVVSPFDGPITSYTEEKKTGLPSLAGLWGEEKAVVFDVQKTLGKEGEQWKKYEFYLQTPSYTQYKYRICYMRYGLGNYPVKVVLAQSVADDLFASRNSNYIINCDTRAELEELIYNILNSKKIINIMQELIRIHFANQSRTEVPLEDTAKAANATSGCAETE